MPGAYAHITAVNVASERMDEVPGFPDEGKAIVLDWLKYCELGAVSPDYPYLHLAVASNSGDWADAMHKERTKVRLMSGVNALKAMPKSLAREKSLAWLLGFTSHVIMDVNIHPVVNRKVGEPYEQHKQAHRDCEMNQDTYIFHTRMNLEIPYADHLKYGICTCSDSADEDKIDPDVKFIWNRMFRAADGVLYNKGFEPAIDGWHDSFEDIVRNIAGSKLVALARHVLPGGCVYPDFDSIDRQYIENLEVPDGRRLHYDDIFNAAVDRVVQGWAAVSSDVLGGPAVADRFLANWNLDNGAVMSAEA
ncbi:MAG: hypothetical protein CVU73_08955 [Deltaproteobacteria bacterium HGW-Deltaproteobacteria-8]|jgi:hypothetical protein|nr:MAG: hypothetical protein CVU73_08955 [Deltaproteobacteria bacterium HGW-Deltaproteobacteria-8]